MQRRQKLKPRWRLANERGLQPSPSSGIFTPPKYVAVPIGSVMHVSYVFCADLRTGSRRIRGARRTYRAADRSACRIASLRSLERHRTGCARGWSGSRKSPRRAAGLARRNSPSSFRRAHVGLSPAASRAQDPLALWLSLSASSLHEPRRLPLRLEFFDDPGEPLDQAAEEYRVVDRLSFESEMFFVNSRRKRIHFVPQIAIGG